VNFGASARLLGSEGAAAESVPWHRGYRCRIPYPSESASTALPTFCRGRLRCRSSTTHSSWRSLSVVGWRGADILPSSRQASHCRDRPSAAIVVPRQEVRPCPPPLLGFLSSEPLRRRMETRQNPIVDLVAPRTQPSPRPRVSQRKPCRPSSQPSFPLDCGTRTARDESQVRPPPPRRGQPAAFCYIFEMSSYNILYGKR